MESSMMGDGINEPRESGAKQLQQKSANDEVQARTIVSQLIKKDGSVLGAFEDFNIKSQEKLTSGKAPNSLFPNVAGIFTQIVPLAESLERLESVKTIIKNPILDNLIYDSTMQINGFLQDNALPLPEIENLSVELEVQGYEQALIEVFNKVPNIRDDDKRGDLLWLASLLNQTIEQAKNRNSQ